MPVLKSVVWNWSRKIGEAVAFKLEFAWCDSTPIIDAVHTQNGLKGAPKYDRSGF
jgi:hypothetical protein